MLLFTLPATGFVLVASTGALMASATRFADAGYHPPPAHAEARELDQRAWLMARQAAEAARTARPDPLLAEALGVEPGSREPGPIREQVRAAMALPVEPALRTVAVIEATVSFYYCKRGTKGPRGDGGGWCGLMRNEQPVRPGAAACAYGHLGQQFRIVGDPTERVYTCEDTGGAVKGEHRDVWFYSSDEGWLWQLKTGRHVKLEILADP